LIDWLFNGTSTQKGQFVPTGGGGVENQLSQAAVPWSDVKITVKI